MEVEEKYYSDVIKFIREVVNDDYNGNFTAACRDWNIPTAATISQWYRESKDKDGNAKAAKNASLRTIGKIFDKIGVKFCSIRSIEDKFSFVRKTSALAGAGSSLVTSDRTIGYYAFRNDYLNKVGVQPKNAVLMDVIGDSMLPALHDGDSLLVDMNDTNVKDGKIYVVTVGDELLVKRVFKTPTGLLLKSENPSFPTIEVSGETIGTSCVVRGRVCWFGGSM